MNAKEGLTEGQRRATTQLRQIFADKDEPVLVGICDRLLGGEFPDPDDVFEILFDVWRARYR